MRHNNSDEENTTIANEIHGVLHDDSNEGSTSIMQDFEEVEEMEMNNNSATNGSNSNDLFKNNSSQESQHGKN